MDLDTARAWLSRVRHWVDFIGVSRLIQGAISMVMVLIVGWFVLKPTAPPVESFIPMATFPVTSTTVAPTQVAVHVAGAVVSPGVYVLPWSSRVVDAVTAAGGPKPQADLDRINLAQVVNDNEQVFIPSRSARTAPVTVAPRHQPTTTTPTSTRPNPSGPSSGGLVDVNTATEAELTTLPGVGPATAKAIIAHREKNAFSRIEELLNVPGIGPSKFAAIKDLVRIS